MLCKRREMYNSLHIQACSAHITILLRGHTHRHKYTFTQRSNVWRRQWSLFVRFAASQLHVSQLEQLPGLLMSCWCLLSSTEKAEWTSATQTSPSQPLPVNTTWRTAYTTSVNARMAAHTARTRSALSSGFFSCQWVWWGGKSIPLNQPVKGFHEICVKLGRTFPDDYAFRKISTAADSCGYDGSLGFIFPTHQDSYWILSSRSPNSAFYSTFMNIHIPLRRNLFWFWCIIPFLSYISTCTYMHVF